MTACKDCVERHPGCHGHCERYLKEKAEHDALSAKRRESLEYEKYRHRLFSRNSMVRNAKNKRKKG